MTDVEKTGRARVKELLRAHTAWRERSLNLIASENVISPAVEETLASRLEGRYADFTGTDLHARKYRGGREVVEVEELCAAHVRTSFGAPACELRAISGHVAGNAVIMGLCSPGDLVLEVSQEGGSHRLATKLAAARLIDLRVQFLPFDPHRFNVDPEASAALVRERRPRLVVLGSSTFLHPHPVTPLAAACDDVGADLVYDGSHVMGLLIAKRFQSPLQEGAGLVFGSTHKTLFGPQGGLIFGRPELVEQAAAALYPPLVTNHHPARIPALSVALEEHAEFGEAYADAVIANARAFSRRLTERGVAVIGGETESHAVLIATPDRRGEEVAVALEREQIITNPSRLPDEHGGQGVRFGLQELTRRGADETIAQAAADLVADGLAGARVADAVAELTGPLQTVRYTWPSS